MIGLNEAGKTMPSCLNKSVDAGARPERSQEGSMKGQPPCHEATPFPGWFPLGASHLSPVSDEAFLTRCTFQLTCETWLFRIGRLKKLSASAYLFPLGGPGLPDSQSLTAS